MGCGSRFFKWRENVKKLFLYSPKTQNPKNVNEFRPISLCNVVYKLISKVLNRLFLVLSEVIAY